MLGARMQARHGTWQGAGLTRSVSYDVPRRTAQTGFALVRAPCIMPFPHVYLVKPPCHVDAPTGERTLARRRRGCPICVFLDYTHMLRCMSVPCARAFVKYTPATPPRNLHLHQTRAHNSNCSRAVFCVLTMTPHGQNNQLNTRGSTRMPAAHMHHRRAQPGIQTAMHAHVADSRLPDAGEALASSLPTPLRCKWQPRSPSPLSGEL